MIEKLDIFRHEGDFYPTDSSILAEKINKIIDFVNKQEKSTE